MTDKKKAPKPRVAKIPMRKFPLPDWVTLQQGYTDGYVDPSHHYANIVLPPRRPVNHRTDKRSLRLRHGRRPGNALRATTKGGN